MREVIVLYANTHIHMVSGMQDYSVHQRDGPLSQGKCFKITAKHQVLLSKDKKKTAKYQAVNGE